MIHKYQTNEAIKELRIELRLTLDGMAEEMGMDRMTIFRYEKGHSNPAYETLKRLAVLALDHNRQDLCEVFLLPISKALDAPVSDVQAIIGRKERVAA
jgi:transcriptional regulator with XRE-family HTH domain